MRILSCFSFLGLASSVLTSSMAHAGMPLTVHIDRSQVMILAEDPGTILVGNPSIADVTVNGRQLFMHGKAFGETNLMIFDGNGTKIADFDVTVSQNSNNQVTVFAGSSEAKTQRHSYSCAPNCEVNMIVGDDADYFDAVVEANRKKADLANGVKTSDLVGKSSSVTLPDAAPQ